MHASHMDKQWFTDEDGQLVGLCLAHDVCAEHGRGVEPESLHRCLRTVPEDEPLAAPGAPDEREIRSPEGRAGLATPLFCLALEGIQQKLDLWDTFLNTRHHATDTH
jgi:hypothetical protein